MHVIKPILALTVEDVHTDVLCTPVINVIRKWHDMLIIFIFRAVT